MANKDEATLNEGVEEEIVQEEVVQEEVVLEDAAQEEVAKAEDAVEPDDSNEGTAEDEAVEAGSDEGAAEDEAAVDEAVEAEAQKTEHDEYVERLAAGFASLVAKGEEVVAALGVQAEVAGKAFEEKAADAGWSDFADEMQARMKAAAAQFTKDLEVFSDAVDKKAEEAVSADQDVTEAPVDVAAAADAVPYKPQFTPATLAMRERMRVGTHSELMLTDPEFVERFANFAFDDVPSDVDLPERTRFMCWLATLLGCQGIDEFRALLPAALNVGVEPEAVKEIVYQATAYLGIGRVYPFLKATNETLMAAGVQLPLKQQATTLPTEESRYEGGEEAQVACFGEQMHGYKDRGAADYPHVAQWLVKNCFGDWYARGGLTIAEREMVTFCYIAAQGGCEPQLRAHAAANVQCGNDRAFLIKVVSNNVPFIGYPRSLNAMSVVEEVTGAKE
ncbi:MAG: carboxymuconolactone decarboxylase family protein [Atopobiaceae bacterium]|nr:carboxymuconolactone decarboxylase family protein [Atopobiaceae bacterium]